MTARLTRGAGGPARLRELLGSGETIVAPGAFDPLAARLVEEAGFPAVYMTGFGTSAALLGRPDVGLLTMTEMAGNAGRIAPRRHPGDRRRRHGLRQPAQRDPHRRDLRGGGRRGIHIEDQVAPKKCGHMEGKQVIAADEMAQKVRAAVEARRTSDFVIIARTDARAVEGLDRALDARPAVSRRRGRRPVHRGGRRARRRRAAARAFPDVPLLFNWAEGGKTPPISLARLRELGYRIVIFPISTLLAATAAMRGILREIATAGTPAAAPE